MPADVIPCFLPRPRPRRFELACSIRGQLSQERGKRVEPPVMVDKERRRTGARHPLGRQYWVSAGERLAILSALLETKAFVPSIGAEPSC